MSPLVTADVENRLTFDVFAKTDRVLGLTDIRRNSSSFSSFNKILPPSRASSPDASHRSSLMRVLFRIILFYP